MFKVESTYMPHNIHSAKADRISHATSENTAAQKNGEINIMTNSENTTYCATVGVFDGVHCGHQQVIRRVIAIAEAAGMKSMVITFDRNPLEVICPERAPKPIMTLTERISRLQAMGVDRIEVLPFDNDFMQTTAFDFMHETLYMRLNVRCMVTGYDNRFGKRNPDENFETYVSYGKRIGINVVLGPQPEECGLFEGRAVSSSLIRHLLDTGRKAEAETLMMLK